MWERKYGCQTALSRAVLQSKTTNELTVFTVDFLDSSRTRVILISAECRIKLNLSSPGFKRVVFVTLHVTFNTVWRIKGKKNYVAALLNSTL
jgi:hypothetical protein